MDSAGETKLRRQFNAAVRVIQGLPKNGPFKPSHELMLKIYAYYKQATVGECKASKPGFWDVVGKAKWEAWSSLGSMSADEAMESYIAELKQIAEVVPQTEEVNGLVKELGHFFELVDIHTGETVSAEQALASYPDNNRISASPESGVSNGGVPGNQRDNIIPPAHESDVSRDHSISSNDLNGLDLISQHRHLADDSTGAMKSSRGGVAPDLVSSDQAEDRLSPLLGDSDTDSEVYVDSSDIVHLNDSHIGLHEKTVDLLASCPSSSPYDTPNDSPRYLQPDTASSNHRIHSSQSEEPITRPKVPNTRPHKPSVSFSLPEKSPPESPLPVASDRAEEVNEKLRMALLNMQQEMQSLEKRLSLVEQITVRQRKRELENSQNPVMRWWPFPGLLSRTTLVILLWPLIVALSVRYLAARRRSRQ